MEPKLKQRGEPRKNILTSIIPFAVAGLALLSACSNWSPIVRHDIPNGKPCEVDVVSSSGFLGAEQFYNSHPEAVETFDIQGNNLIMRAQIYNMLHIIVARYGGTLENMQASLENLYPGCNVILLKINNTGNNVSQANADIKGITDKLGNYVTLGKGEFPNAVIVYISNFETSQGEEVEKQRLALIKEAMQRFKDEERVIVSKDISPEVVYNAQGQFDQSFLIIQDNGKGMHLQPVEQAKWFMIITNPDFNSFK